MAPLTEWIKDNFRIERVDMGPHALEGSVDGIAVRVQFTAESHGSVTLWRTEVKVPYTAGTPEIRLAIRHSQWVFEDLLRAGLMRDLEFGEPEFDGEFVVDGAPADIVRALVDAPTRSTLLALRPIAVSTELRELVVSRSEWIRDTAELERLVAFTMDLVRRIEPATLEATERQRALATGATYRTFKSADEIAAERADDLRAHEALAARRTKAQRRSRRIATAWVLLIAAALLLATGAAVLWCG